MADNTLQDGTDKIATDELSTLNGSDVSGENPRIKAQRSKVGFGSDGAFRDVDAANPLPVEDDAAATVVQEVSDRIGDVAAPAAGTSNQLLTDILAALGGALGVNVLQGAVGFSLGDPVDTDGVTVRAISSTTFSHGSTGESADLIAAPGAGLQIVVLGYVVFAEGPAQIISGAGGPVKEHLDSPGAATHGGGMPVFILDENDALRVDNDGATLTKGRITWVVRDVP